MAGPFSIMINLFSAFLTENCRIYELQVGCSFKVQAFEELRKLSSFHGNHINVKLLKSMRAFHLPNC